MDMFADEDNDVVAKSEQTNHASSVGTSTQLAAENGNQDSGSMINAFILNFFMLHQLLMGI